MNKLTKALLPFFTQECQQAVIISHTDPDGWASARIVLTFLERIQEHLAASMNRERYIELQSNGKTALRTTFWNYGDKLDYIESLINRNDPNTPIFILDLTLPVEFMNKYCDRIFWIDHHRSAIQSSRGYAWRHSIAFSGSAEELPTEFLTVVTYDKEDSCIAYYNHEMQIAACELCWFHCFGLTPMPLAVHLIGRYDVWDHYTPEVKYFSEYLRSTFTGDCSAHLLQEHDFKTLFEGIYSIGYVKDDTPQSAGMTSALRVGQQIGDTKDKLNDVDAKQRGAVYRLTVNNKTFLAYVVNRGNINSEYFQRIARKTYQTILAKMDITLYPATVLSINFAYDLIKRIWTVSFFDLEQRGLALEVMESFKRDMGDEIVSSGGGHPNACGMTMVSIVPFLEKLDLTATPPIALKDMTF